MLAQSQIQRMFPNALPEWMAAFSKIAPELARYYKWTDHDWRHFCGQVYAETNGLSLRTMRENMRFTTASRIKTVYSYRLRLALKNDRALAREHGTVDNLAAFLVGKPDLLADIVYSSREGTPAGMGHRYIGRGPTQITHLDNYAAIRDEIRRGTELGRSMESYIKAGKLAQHLHKALMRRFVKTIQGFDLF